MANKAKGAKQEERLLRPYRFVGMGEGIPGLPHEVTEGQAQALGVLDVLKTAIKAGNYEEDKQVQRTDDVHRTRR